MQLFQSSIFKSINQDEALVATRWAEYQKYLAKVEYIEDVKEDNFDREIKLKKESERFESVVVESEREIDRMVYELYGLSEDEILIVEGE